MKPRRDDSTRQASQAQIAGMPVVILCGGQGTRLREHTDNVPKPMVEIGDQPILWHIMKLYGMRGFRRFILCLGYYITPALVGGASDQMISGTIERAMNQENNWGKASALGALLLFVTMALFFIYNRLVGIDKVKLG